MDLGCTTGPRVIFATPRNFGTVGGISPRGTDDERRLLPILSRRAGAATSTNGRMPPARPGGRQWRCWHACGNTTRVSTPVKLRPSAAGGFRINDRCIGISISAIAGGSRRYGIQAVPRGGNSGEQPVAGGESERSRPVVPIILVRRVRPKTETTLHSPIDPAGDDGYFAEHRGADDVCENASAPSPCCFRYIFCSAVNMADHFAYLPFGSVFTNAQIDCLLRRSQLRLRG